MRQSLADEARSRSADAADWEEQSAAGPESNLSFEDLLRIVQPKMTQVLARYRIPAQDAEDVLQEAFVTLVHKWSVIRNPEAWLLVTLRNRCLIYWRRKRKQLYQAVDTAILELLSEPEAPGQRTAELRHDLDRLVARLPDRCQSVLRLRYGLGCSSSEVADQLGYRHSSIRKVTSRCLASLTKELASAEFDPLRLHETLLSRDA